MAKNKESYPMLPSSAWWTLREQFKRSIPPVVDANYVASVLSMSAGSASNNVLPYLRAMGIINENGKPEDRAVKWRDDGHYKEVCEAIKKEVYPQQLLDIGQDSEKDRNAVVRWLSNKTGKGTNAVRKMATTYLLLTEADVAKAPKGKKTPEKKASNGKAKPQPNVLKVKELPKPEGKDDLSNGKNIPPSIHFNVQIHIASDVTAEQIDQIFSSMAKHLKLLTTT